MKITVAVPTIDGRSAYLASCLQTCVSQREDFEILVSDNPGGSAREVAASFNDPRIRYVTPPYYLHMSAHWDFVLTKVTGDLVTIIGDDDGLMPGCIKRVTEIRSQTGDLPIHHALGNYWWPDAADAKRRGKVEFHHAVGRGQKIVGSADFLRSVARARARYVDGPMVYHNFIPTALLRRISRDGICFRRASPDVYSAVAIAANTEAFVSIDELLTLSGQGARANGAAVRTGNAPKFMAEAREHYPSRFAGSTIQLQLVDALMEAAEVFNRPDLLRELRLGAHLAAALLETRRMPYVQRTLVLNEARKRGVLMKLCTSIAKRAILRMVKRRQATEYDHAFEGGAVVQTDAVDIHQATRQVQAILDVAPYYTAPKMRALTAVSRSRCWF